MENDPTYQPDEEPLDERLPLLCERCGAMIPDGAGFIPHPTEALLCQECAVDRTKPTLYRGYEITFDAKPIPTRTHDWGWTHEDYDGAPDEVGGLPLDHRCGYSRSFEAAKEEIDDQIAEREEDAAGTGMSGRFRRFTPGERGALHHALLMTLEHVSEEVREGISELLPLSGRVTAAAGDFAGPLLDECSDEVVADAKDAGTFGRLLLECVEAGDE